MTGVDVTLLQHLVALVAERKVTKAAERQNISQAAMSHALARLRELFDDPMLVRGQGQMIPTARALELAAGATKILADLEKLVTPSSIFDPCKSEARFVLSATEYVEYLLAPKLVVMLQEQAPGIDIEIRRPSRSMASSWLETGEIDLRIGWSRDPAPALRSKLLFQDRFVCVARKSHPIVQDRITLNEYVRLPQVRSQVGQSSRSGHDIDKLFASVGAKLRINVLVQNHLTTLFLVAQSDSIATVPEKLARAFAESLSLQLIDLPFKITSIRNAMYWHEHRHNEPRHQWLRKFIAKVAQGL